jgi:hypothetical protein
MNVLAAEPDEQRGSRSLCQKTPGRRMENQSQYAIYFEEIVVRTCADSVCLPVP